MIGGPLRKLYGSAVIAAHLRGQRRVPYLARERLDELRDRRVRRIVAYAARAVPHYRDLFRRERIDPAEIRGVAELDRLPLLDRELLRSRPELFVAESPAGRSALEFATSGTTGTPLRIRHDRRSLLANFAFGERERASLIRATSAGFRPKELYVGYDTSTFKKVTAFYAESTLLPVKPDRRVVSILEPIEKIAAIANAERPDVLVGYGAWIALFFRTLAARGMELHPPKAVIYMGEALPHGTRAFLEDELGIPVLSRYNAVEAFKIGFFCEHRTGFHVHEDLCHVRVVDAAGRDTSAGEAGRVVLSNLVNRATVLLNYPIGDTAALSDAPCACGRTFRLLSELEGRTEDILSLPDGRTLHPRAIWEVLKGDRDVLQYCLRERAGRRYDLELATVDDAAFERARARAGVALQQLLDADAQIEVSRRLEIDRSRGRKFRVVEAAPSRRTE